MTWDGDSTMTWDGDSTMTSEAAPTLIEGHVCRGAKRGWAFWMLTYSNHFGIMQV